MDKLSTGVYGAKAFSSCRWHHPASHDGLCRTWLPPFHQFIHREHQSHRLPDLRNARDCRSRLCAPLRVTRAFVEYLELPRLGIAAELAVKICREIHESFPAVSDDCDLLGRGNACQRQVVMIVLPIPQVQVEIVTAQNFAFGHAR